MKLLFTAVLLLAIAQGRAQTTNPPPQDSDSIYTKVEIESQFIGGKAAWERFLNKNLQYPREARKNKIKGDVVVQFQVDMQGHVSDIRAVDGPETGGLREEAIRLISISHMWTPAVSEQMRQVKSYKKVIISFPLHH